VLNPGQCGVNINIVGDVNMKVEGNMIEHITKNKYTTIDGNEYRTTKGNTYITQHGDETTIRDGKTRCQTKNNHELFYDGDYSLVVSKTSTISSKSYDIQAQMYSLYTKKTTSIRNSGSFTCETLGKGGETWSSAGPVYRQYNSDEFIISSGELHRSAKIVVDSATKGCYRYSLFGELDDAAMNITSRAMNIKRHALMLISDNSMLAFDQSSMATFKRTCLGTLQDGAPLISHDPPAGAPVLGKIYVTPGTTV
jgi:hypothetical protein